MDFRIDQEAYIAYARKAVAEGCVLIKNENKTLPLQKNDKVAVFGRMAANYYKSGLGSGGLVNTRYVTGILDALKTEESISLDEKLLNVYEDWNKEHPIEKGEGWGSIPWCQTEMPLEETLVESCAKENDVALVIIGRTAGEDQDNHSKAGSFLLTKAEHDMIEMVSKHFNRAAVLLNVGNIIDMNWVEELSVPCAMYVWQGGQEGGNGVLDVLMGYENPSGKLSDTIAKNIKDYPSDAYFGDKKQNVYAEDIYVGYRYFETFAKDRVLYPFGYGLSYTNFSMNGAIVEITDSEVVIEATIQNTGACSGKEVAQLYVKAPQGKLGKASRVLVAFEKTKELACEEATTIRFEISKYTFSSFDDSGVTGKKNAYVLEEGCYEFFLGSDVRSAKLIGSYEQAFEVVEQLEEATAPMVAFKRMKPQADENGNLSVSFEDVPLRTVDMAQRRLERLPKALEITGDCGITLDQVYENKADMDSFIAQLSAEELMYLFRGEGMSSPKVTPGTGSAFGGLCEQLKHYRIPAMCTTDGPSGLRMDCGTKAFSLPNGTLLGCTFNLDLVENLYTFTGKELRRNRVDALLGPGMNIHRHPLNGRNFEYISEDPLLTGKCGAAQVRGLSCVNSTATIKHFIANNQEHERNNTEGVISQRAIREIYLKGFEIAVKEADARSVMTTYGPVNNTWTSSNYDLCTTILRKEWGFDGIVMTDWWAKGSKEGGEGKRKIRAYMVGAGNDLYMVTPDQTDQTQDDLAEAYNSGLFTLADLQENARHILSFILKSTAMQYEMDLISDEEKEDRALTEEGDVNFELITYYSSDEEGTIRISNPDWNCDRGEMVVFATDEKVAGLYNVRMTVHSKLGELAQLPVTVFCDSYMAETITFQGSNGEKVTKECALGNMFTPTHYIKVYFGADGLTVDEFEIYRVGDCQLAVLDFEND